ncbi:MAG: PQQ-binding-like beta-propeller repeat protein [Planctomycetota bacterium]
MRDGQDSGSPTCEVPAEKSSTEQPLPPRWWPALAIFSLATISATAIWNVPDVMQQMRVLLTILGGSVTFLLSFWWAVFFSRFPKHVRRKIFVAVATVSIVGGALLEVRGVTGDFVPIVTWRWAPKPDQELRVEARVRRPGDEVAGAEDEGPVGTPKPEIAVIGIQDSPQFLGLGGRSIVPGVSLAKSWNEAAMPEEVWRRDIGAGWSSFAVAGGEAYTLEQRGDDEIVVCYRLTDGEALWSHADDGRYSSVIAGDGPRSTPALTANRVYTYGATGRLNCLDRFSGEVKWTRNVLEENDASVPEWGVSCSPLIYLDMVIVSAGGSDGKSLVAYDRKTGESRWSSGSDRAGYSSPVLARFGDRFQIVLLNHGSVAGHDAVSGELLWEHPWDAKRPNVAQPHVLEGGRVLVSSGYGVGAELLKVSPSESGEYQVEVLWKNRNLKAKFSNFVVKDDFVYGLDDGILVCLDLDTGERRWKQQRFGHGQMLLFGDLLLISSEKGAIHLVEPSPEEFRLLGKKDILYGRTWQGPTYAQGLLLMRNDRHAVALKLPTR